MRSQTTKFLTLASLILASLGLLCAEAFGGGTAGFTLNVLLGETPRPEYYREGTVYVEAIRGKSYALRLTNPTPYRVAVALSVDGLNTIDARHTDPRSAAKWVLEPYGSTVISGWQVNDRAARRFFFTGENQSYGAALGQTDNLGVIEAVYYRERHRSVSTYQLPRDERNEPSVGEASGQGAKGRDAEGTPRSDSAMPAPEEKKTEGLSDDYAATGMGHRTRHEVKNVDIDLETQPVASVRIRYEFRPQLVKLGIFAASFSPLERRERSSGFNSYCPEPR
jgi:hypothetical protein